jgi:glycosyltransferase involved in cell wall biosynthesis
MGSPRASIVVRCYNEAEHIGKLLHGISEQTVDDYEVVLVDSGSTDGTIEIAEEFGVDTVTYIDPEDFSFGRALNYGVEAADGEFCVIASAHVYPKREDWLERLLEKFADDDVALVYGKQRGNDVTTFSENQIFKQWFPEHDIEHQPHPFCNNANAAIRRDVWEEFPYDEHLTGLEDVDWAKRVQKAGYEISYAAEAEIIHVHDESARQVFNRYRREAYAHKEIMPDQSFSFTDFLWLSAKNVLSDYRAAAEEGVLRENAVEIPTFRLLQFWGTYRGFAKQGPISDSLWQRFFYPDRESYPPHHTPTSRDAASEAAEIDYPEDGEFLPGTERNPEDD